ncbi:hypothetical protein T229_13715 [Tannerella sp. oral taxon BU063 isolate Cell 5]|uniref:Uncharacterized protein n=1 Tax=Tannerella sp. oral taxon BU063 isolate Cell 5 TaxID=1410950 RepID=W2C924_9BACT|nr:hypothetical protein T229_13715 [Tannerella sp. oral taxon BU063 isolate Cell 5]
MMINDMAFVSCRKRLVGVFDTPLPYRQEKMRFSTYPYIGYTNDMRFCMAFVSGRKRLMGVFFCALPYRQDEM